MSTVQERIDDKPTRPVRRSEEFNDEPTRRVVYLPATLRRFYDTADFLEALEEAERLVDKLEMEDSEHGD